MADPTGPEHNTPPNLMDWTFAWARAVATAPIIATDWMMRQAQGGDGYTTTTIPDPRIVTRTFAEVGRRLMAEPGGLSMLTAQLLHEHTQLLQHTFAGLFGLNGTPMVEPVKGDRRFEDHAWKTDPWFGYLKQAYLLNARWAKKLVDEADGLDEHTRHQAEFFIRLLTNALSPTNFFATNPKAMRLALDSRGGTVLHGLEHYIDDLAKHHGEVRPHQTRERAFKFGENIAITPGEVIFRNDLMELIQYSPTTEQVFQRPLLIVPPWINKFYIMDLKPKNSFVRWAVEQGHTVLMVSWINPDGRHAHKRFDDYMLEGPLAALDVIEQVTGERQVNAIGYCIGGTLLACTLACLAARGQEKERFASATFFTCMLDYSEPGDLGVFLDEPQIEEIEGHMAKLGYMEGAYMAHVFNLLRDNELIWGVHTNNYLYGNEPPPFDLLYWNSDSTRIPAATQSWYVRNMYLKNRLVEPDALSLDHTPLDLRRIDTPSYFLSTQEDHIAPWRSTYKGPRHFKGPVRFVLGGSGHIAGAMNPPGANKYFYLTNPVETLPDDPQTWFEGAQRNDGSWWTDWAQWVAQYGGEQVPARQPGSHDACPALEHAPGSYVKIRADDGSTALPRTDGSQDLFRLTLQPLEQLRRLSEAK